MLSWFSTRYRLEDTLGKAVLIAEIMGVAGFLLVLIAMVLNWLRAL